MLLALSSPIDRVRNGNSHMESAVLSETDNQAQWDNAVDCNIPDGNFTFVLNFY
jgi:hypothetical protein